jgi:hypothetical protein
MLKIHEVSATTGLSAVFLRFEDGVLAVVGPEGTFALPDEALASVMSRFGAPLDPAARVAVVATLELGNGRSLGHVRHLARYDVIARDYLVYHSGDEDPLCALATTVAAALAHLGLAAGGRAPQEAREESLHDIRKQH